MTTSTPDLSTARRRPSLPWFVAGAGVVVAAVVVTLVLTAGDEEVPKAAGATTATSAEKEPGYDLSTPESAAASFAAAASTGSGEALLDLACVGRAACASEHSDEAQLTEAQSIIRDGVFELSEHLKGAEFGQAVDGAVPGTKEVPYRTPTMTGDAYLTFVQSEGDWLFYLPTS